MKSKIFSLLFSLLFLTAFHVQAQDNICESGYMPFKEGIYTEVSHYNKKNKLSTVAKQKVTGVEEIDGGFKATVDLVYADDKGKEQHKGSYAIECKDGTLYMDMSALINPQAMAGFEDLEMEVTGTAMAFPNSLEAGQTLPDGNLVMTAKTGGLAFSMNMNVTNRKVEAMESVTTPAGTFDCVKISQDTELKTIIKNKFRTVTWYAKGVGMVKSENYDTRDNLESSSLLTKLER
jgi:hypothetical protein